VGAAVGSGLPAAGLTVRWLNDHGGLNGHPVKLVTGDSQSDPSRYAALVKQMVERDRVIAFVGNQVPLSAQGGAQYLVDHGVPAVGGDLTQELWFQNPMMFPHGSTLETLALGVMQIAAQQSKPKVAVFWCTEADVCGKFNQYMSSSKAKATGADLVYSAQISLAQPDFTSECLQAKQRGAQAIMLAMDPNAQSRVARSCTQQGYSPMWLGASMAIADVSKNDPNLNGMWGSVPIFPWPAADSPATQLFQAAVKQYAPNMITGAASASVWTAGMLLRSIAGSISDTPSSADIVNGLYTVRNTTVDGLTSSLTYEKGKPYTVPSCYFTVKIDGGKWVAPDGSKPRCINF